METLLKSGTDCRSKKFFDELFSKENLDLLMAEKTPCVGGFVYDLDTFLMAGHHNRFWGTVDDFHYQFQQYLFGVREADCSPKIVYIVEDWKYYFVK